MPYIRKEKKEYTPQYPEEKELNLPKWIRSRDDLNWGEKAFLSDIISIDRSHEEKCYYSLKHLAKRFFVSNITIHNWTKKLVNLQLLQILTKLDEENGNMRILKPTLFHLAAK